MPTLPDGTEVPDIAQVTGAAMAAGAASVAQNAAERAARQALYDRLPKFLHPLVPGHGGSVSGEIQKAISKWFWGIVGGCLFSVFFFGFAALIVLSVGGYVVFEVIRTM